MRREFEIARFKVGIIKQLKKTRSKTQGKWRVHTVDWISWELGISGFKIMGFNYNVHYAPCKNQYHNTEAVTCVVTYIMLQCMAMECNVILDNNNFSMQMHWIWDATSMTRQKLPNKLLAWNRFFLPLNTLKLHCISKCCRFHMTSEQLQNE